MSQITREKMKELEHLLLGARAALATEAGGLRQAREAFEQAANAFRVEAEAINGKVNAVEESAEMDWRHFRRNTSTIWRRLMWLLRGPIAYVEISDVADATATMGVETPSADHRGIGDTLRVLDANEETGVPTARRA